MAKLRFWVGFWIIGVVFLCGCGSPDASLSEFPGLVSSSALTRTPFQPVPWTPTPVGTATPTPPPYALWMDPHLPEGFRQQVEVPAEFGLSSNPDRATIRLEISDADPVSRWIYALVAPFPTIVDGVSSQDLRAAWQGESRGDFQGVSLVMDDSTLGTLTVFWGEPASDTVVILPPDEILQTAWDSRPSWAIVPFDELNPHWKVLAVDGVSPVHKEFNSANYALSVPISIIGDTPIQPGFPISNRNPDRLTVLAMTGVTALVRATAHTMELRGINYPAQDIGGWLREADITHISNEVPFAKDCPYPNPVQQGMRFCSAEKYIGLLDHVGTDVVELTGDHFSDWGSAAMLFTLDLYDERGWPYYGGGATLEEGRQAITLTHNGNQIAFIGCNAKGGVFARAGSSTPGAVPCDFDWMQSEIERLTAGGYLVIGTFQHFEYYTYSALDNQKRDAKKLTDAGAVIVSGSQAHHPQAFEFSGGGFVHHGLGNLFFDQYSVSTGARQGFIDRHVFYDGKHISTELLTILFVDYARARPMTPGERSNLLTVVFRASGW